MMRCTVRVLLLLLGGGLSVLCLSAAAEELAADRRNPFFAYLTGQPSARLVTYTPSQLDPRFEANQSSLATHSIRADLAALRPAFDGLVLYGYHEACTPRIVALARELKFRAVVLGIWNPKSAAELDGVSRLAELHADAMALAVLVGNEGLTFNRYEEDDLAIAAERLRATLPPQIPLATSEPLVGYQRAVVPRFGDFLAPNIHPVFDRSQLSASDAAQWARQQAAELARQHGKPVLLKETGFPHAGREGYSEETQEAFWRAYLKAGKLHRPEPAAPNWVFYGIAFEAFDLPWKAEESKLAMEKSWGLMSPDRRPYPAFEVWRTWREPASGQGP